jgi:hypothetical protein
MTHHVNALYQLIRKLMQKGLCLSRWLLSISITMDLLMYVFVRSRAINLGIIEAFTWLSSFRASQM